MKAIVAYIQPFMLEKVTDTVPSKNSIRVVFENPIVLWRHDLPNVLLPK